jgi:hypothetical protein
MHRARLRNGRRWHPLPALDLAELLRDIPRGAWVAISANGTHVVAYGADVRQVVRDAKYEGESDPIITRVPETKRSVICERTPSLVEAT